MTNIYDNFNNNRNREFGFYRIIFQKDNFNESEGNDNNIIELLKKTDEVGVGVDYKNKKIMLYIKCEQPYINYNQSKKEDLVKIIKIYNNDDIYNLVVKFIQSKMPPSYFKTPPPDQPQTIPNVSKEEFIGLFENKQKSHF